MVAVSHETGTAAGEEPMSVNPVNPEDLTTVANVYQPIPPLSIAEDPLYGGGGVQDTRVYSSRDGGCHWRSEKLDQGGLGRVTVPVAGDLGPEAGVRRLQRDHRAEERARPSMAGHRQQPRPP